jgi:hypothetical protein
LFAAGQNSGLAGEGAGENQMKITSRRWWLASIAAAAVAVSAVLATVASAEAGATSSKPSGLGQSSGLLPPDHLTLESAIVNAPLDENHPAALSDR